MWDPRLAGQQVSARGLTLAKDGPVHVYVIH